jgi:hypothetical protein
VKTRRSWGGPLSLLARRGAESWDFERGTSAARCSRTTDLLISALRLSALVRFLWVRVGEEAELQGTAERTGVTLAGE